MPSISYGTGAYKRDNGNFPPLRLINMFVEAAKTSEGGVAIISRPGLGEAYTVGDGPINGIFARPDVFSGDIFTVSDNKLYRATTLLGTIAGSGPVKWATSGPEIVLTRGTTAYSYNGTNLAAITLPDSFSATAVAFIGSLFVFARDGSGKFYWSDPLDGRTVDSLNFATAERSGDNLTDIHALGDNLWLFGGDSIEAWAHTGDADLPFTRIEQVAPTKGLIATGALCECDNSIIFVGADGVVYRIAETPQRISDHWLEEKISVSTLVRLFSFRSAAHEIVVIRLDDETYALDLATEAIGELQTSVGNWIAQCAAQVGTRPYFGHSETNQVMTFSAWTDLGEELERRFSFYIPLDEPLSIDNLIIWANVGQSGVLTGLGSDPVMEIRTSDDAGITWSDWDAAELGGPGDYRMLPELRALGMYDFPGFLGEARVTDPVPFRVSAVKINTRVAGRQRG